MFWHDRPSLRRSLEGIGPDGLVDELINVSRNSTLRNRRFSAKALGPLLVPGLLLWTARKLNSPIYENDIVIVITLGLYVLAIGNLFFQSYVYVRHYLVEELIRRGLRPFMCVNCGYDLRGTPDESTACPECGAKIAAVKHDPDDAVDEE